jgi:hypothetical protein
MSLQRFSPVTNTWVNPSKAQRYNGTGLSPGWVSLQWVKEWVASQGQWISRWPIPKALITDRTLSVGSGAPDPNSLSTCGYRINANGQAEMQTQGNYFSLEKWLKAGTADQFAVRATHLNSPDLPQGFALDTWHSATLSPEWWVQGTVNAPKDSYLQIDIAYVDTDITLYDTAGNPLLDTDGNPITIAGPAYTVLDGAKVGLRAGK